MSLVEVTSRFARPLTAVSSTISLPGSRNCGPPEKMNFHWLGHRYHGIDKDMHFLLAQSSCNLVFGP